MYQKLRRQVARNLVNLYGWKTDRKIVVVESDDWGSIRMPSKEVYHKFLKMDIPVDRSPYCKYDSLASEDDLHALYDVLTRYRDVNNNYPVITANAVVANPDFNRIKASDFNEYHFELISETFKRYPEHSGCLKLWQEGRSAGVFYPQLHGREHLNVKLWLKLLQNKDHRFLFAFKNRCWGLSGDVFPDMQRSIQAAFDMEDQDDLFLYPKILKEGCQLFEDIFGYKSKSFIANNFIWDPSLNKILFEEGVKYLQGMKYQKHPLLNNKKHRMTRHYLGERNKFGQYYLIRNCTFEPSQKGPDFNNVEECIKDIANAFFWKKPAIISSHRLNYIGYLDIGNRDRNLYLLDSLINNIIKIWPDVEFLTSEKLGHIIEKDKSGS